MTWRRFAAVAVCLSVSLTAAESLHAAEPLARLFPSDTIAYVRLDAAPKRLAGANPHWADGKRVAAELERAVGMLCLNNGEALALTPAEASQVRASLRQVALAWTPGAKGAVSVAGAALFADAKVPQLLIARARDRGLIRATTLSGKPAWQLAESGFNAWLFAHGPALAVWVDKNRAAQMIGQAKANLSVQPSFVRAGKAPSSEGAVWAWADMTHARALWRRLLPAPARQAWGAFESGLGLDKATAVSAAYGGPGALADQCTVRVWLAGAAPLWVQWAGMEHRWRLAGAIPQGCRWAAWGPCDKAAGAWPLVKHTMARLETGKARKPFATLTAGLEAVKGLNLVVHLGNMHEFALLELGDPKLKSTDDRLVLLLHAKDAGAAAAFVKQLDSAALAATSQPTQRRPGKGFVVGQWLTRAKAPAGVYLLRGPVIALGVRQGAVMAVAGAIQAGKTLGAQAGVLARLKQMGPPHVVIFGRTDRFLSASPESATLARLLRADVPAVAALRFYPDGLRLQTTLPGPVLALLAATGAVR